MTSPCSATGRRIAGPISRRLRRRSEGGRHERY
jgi:hypothetical protein